mmetsp:Transcript_29633/g.88668  ORF Transcript_29633/g.88668 Transcript_29633/m.88668 type:complete len:502 (-) Transcript_29633:107-1612(-)
MADASKRGAELGSVDVEAASRQKLRRTENAEESEAGPAPPDPPKSDTAAVAAAAAPVLGEMKIFPSAKPMFTGKIDDPGRKLVVGMVGLPARGKSYLARKLAYYLNWMEINTSIFNHGDYRRKRLGGRQPAEFFRPDNEEGMKLRLDMAKEALTDLLEFLSGGGRIGILDATNSSRLRRTMVQEECDRHGISVFWVESVCTNQEVISATISDIKAKLPEYSDMRIEQIQADFRQRIAFYEAAYTPLDSTGAEADTSFMRITNIGEDIQLHKVNGSLQHRIIRFLMSLHPRRRSIYLTRHGESIFNKSKRLGGDSGLSQAGIKYSVALKAFMQRENVPNLKVWTSSLQRTIQTAALFENVTSFKALDELNAGQCEGLTYEEIKDKYPAVNESRSKNKYYYRYPRGESYKDVVERLEPLLVELEREENLLVVSHQAVARCLLSYFKTIPHDKLPGELPYLEVPLHTVLKVTPMNQGCKIEKFVLGPDAVNTHQPQSRPPSGEK